MKILLVSDWAVPSGYHTIGEPITLRWTELGHKLTVLGSGYKGQEHFYPFCLIPTSLEWLPIQIDALRKELKPDWIIFLMDAEKANAINQKLSTNVSGFHSQVRTAAIFPVESDPITADWADRLRRFYNKRLTFTDFGVRVLREAGIEASKLTVGLDPSWYTAIDEVSIMDDEASYILTVADNQLRKNLPDGLEVFKRFHDKHPEYKYLLVTRVGNPIGWDLKDIIKRLGIEKSTAVVSSSSVERDQLRRFMRKASAVLSTTLAEGIGLPIYETQAQGTPVVATRCCGIPEAMVNKDLLIDVDKVTVFNWGTSNHYWPNIDDAVNKLELAITLPRQVIQYPTWEIAADQIIKVLCGQETDAEQKECI